jgi:exoribonuclease R
MTKYKIIILDKSYRKYQIKNEDGNIVDIKVDFKKYKLFHEDCFDIDENNNLINIHSPVKQHKYLSGILVLAENKTYGRSGRKMLYKCVSDSKYLPSFLIPYQPKTSFEKQRINLYVTYVFNHWDNKHPHGKLKHTIGTVDKLCNFYEYQLYCKSLNASIQKFTRETSRKLKTKSEKEFIKQIFTTYPTIKNRIHIKDIITIDPPESNDYDDAFQLEIIDDSTKKLYIYISNVSIWMDILNLWGAFSNRISTIYLPDRRRPMLPTCLSECLCSLVEDQVRFVLTGEFTIKNNEIVDVSYYNSAIKVSKNYGYDDASLNQCQSYIESLKIAKKLIKKDKLISHVRNSHDLVAYLMILMNYHTAKKMVSYKNGIYRSAYYGSLTEDLPKTITDDAKNFIKIWNCNGGKYLEYNESLKHELLGLDNYIHITSPIRRLIDLINIIVLQQNLKIVELSENSILFLSGWIKKLDYINDTMKAIKKIQTNCSLLELCQNTEVMEKTYKGVIFDKILRNDGMYQYHVYLYDIKMVSKLKILNNLDNYEEKLFKLYYFKNESQLKQKIKLMLIN